MSTATPSPLVEPSAYRGLTFLLGRFRAEASARGAHGREFVLGVVALAAERLGDFLQRCARRARHVAAEIEAADRCFDEIAADGRVTEEERLRYKARLALPRADAAELATALEKAVTG